VQVEGLQAGLIDKIDRNVAELIVQKKYEDIVQYLQDALEASSEDEDNFKNIAAELEEKLRKLASTKSDRLEIQPIQESLVKAEANIAKLMGQSRDGGKSEDVYSKEQIDELMDYKVDKETLEELVNQVIKSRRKKGGDPAAPMTDRGNTSNTDKSREEPSFPAFPPTTKDRKGGTGFPNSTPGVFRAPSEGGRAGGASNDPRNRASRNLSSSTTPGTSSMYSGTGYSGVPAGIFPPANGAIALNPADKQMLRSQSTDGLPQAKLPADMDDDNVCSRSNSPSKQRGDEYSHLGAVVKGGGFNTRIGSAGGSGRPPSVTALSEAHSRSSSPTKAMDPWET
jgi:predicted metal-dependent hydrolase